MKKPLITLQRHFKSLCSNFPGSKPEDATASVSEVKPSLKSRLSKHLLTSAAAVAMAAGGAGDAKGAVVYWNYNRAIGATVDGLYVNVESGVTYDSANANVVFPGWDINPYGTSSTAISFFWSQTSNGASAGVRLNTVAGGTSSGTTIASLPPGFVVGSQITGGASGASFGTGSANFTTTNQGKWIYNSDNYFGFRFTASDGQIHYGWGRIYVGANALTRTMLSVAYETVAGQSIVVGGGDPNPPCTNPTLSAVTTATTCAGQTNGAIDLTATGGSPTPLTYAWTVAGSTTVIATTEDISGKAAGNYVVKAMTASGGCYTLGNYTISAGPAVTNDTTTISACDSYTWSANGQTYTQSGSYTSTSACATNILNLTITASSTTTSTETAVGSYTWSVDGQTYTQSGTYSSVTGCATSILNLTIGGGCSPTPQPSTACYETATWDSINCQWNITGTAPTQPTTACYETATWDSTSCSWNVTGTQPSAPTGLACYETATFNGTTCQWDVTGTQPSQPSIACYETATWNGTTCQWDVTGTQPAQPSTAVDINVSYTGNCGFLSGTYTNSGLLNGYYDFQYNANGFTYHISYSGTEWVLWVFDYTNNGFMSSSATSNGLYPPSTGWVPTQCFDGTLSWNYSASLLACYQTVSWDSANCQWNVTGTQPSQPSIACYETATFNDSTCQWDVTGTQPSAPTGLACYETATFNDTTCQWDVTGSPNSTISSTIVACDNYTWTADGQTYTQSGTYSYTSGCQDYTLNLTIAPITAVSASVTSPILCNGGSATVTVTVTGGTAPYTGDGTQSAGAGSWSYTVVDANGCSATSNQVTITEPTKLQAGLTSTSSTCGQSNGSATVTASDGTTPYTYLWSNGATTSTAGSLSANTYTVTVTDANGCTATGSTTVSSSGLAVGNTGTIQGAAGACRNTTLTYSIASVSNATSYSWSLPTGASGSSVTNSISVTFDNTYSGGFICVTPSNSCGNGTQACISVAAITAKPVSPNGISGPASACGPGTYTYSVTPIWNATSYNWTVSGTGATIVSGQGTSTVQISSSAGFAGTQIGVSASNCKGTSSITTRTVYGLLTVSSPLFGTVYPCAGSTVNYSCDNIAGAVSYSWSVTGNATVTASNGTSCTVAFANNWTGGAINLIVTNACGSATRSYILYASAPQPGGISGVSTALCPAGGTNSSSFSIAPVSGATSYAWTVPTGMQITGGSGNTTNLTVNINNNYTGGSVCVSAVNSCGTGTPRCLVTSAKPAQPGAVTGPVSVCKSQSAVTYSINAVNGANFYSWVMSNGGSMTPIATGLTANANFTAMTSNSGIISVRSNNACGTSSPSNLTVAVNLTCRQSAPVTSEDLSVAAYPNPNNGRFTVTTPSLEMEASLYIYSMDGRLVRSYNVPANTSEIQLDLGQHSAGLYQLRFAAGEKSESVKIIVE
jgi:hypothetical protein